MKYSSFLIPQFSKYCAVVLLVVVLLGMLAFTASAQTPPTPPSRFVGSATINGQEAPIGTTVIATIDGVPCGSGTVNAAGKYVLDVVATDSCGSSVVTIAFVVSGFQAAEFGTWQNDQLNVLDLSVDTAVSVDTSVSEVVVPAPPNTGSGLDLKPATASPFNSDGVFILVFASLFVLSISYRLRMLSQEK